MLFPNLRCVCWGMENTKPMKSNAILCLILAAFAALNPALRAGTIWVSDAELVLGQPDFESTGSSAADTQVADPQGICVDPDTGKVFVADHFNHRVLRYASASSLTNGAAAEIVLGQTGFLMSTPGVSEKQMREPFDVAIDSDGNLWVADMGNHRILRFDNAATIGSGAEATLVLGQADFSGSGNGTAANQLNRPNAIDFDAAGNLYIGDGDNARILIHLNANSKSNGEDADILLGQTAYGAPSFMISQQISHYSGGLAVDADGTLFVSGMITNRIMVWENAATLVDGAPADRVIGQANFTAMASGLSATKMTFPQHLAINSEGTLFVADKGNNRVLVFNNASSLSGEVPADAVLGQSDAELNVMETSQDGMNQPGGVALDDEGRLIVGDGGNGRVLFFSMRTTRPDAAIITDSGERIGDDILNTTAALQKVSLKSSARKTFHHLGIGNDGSDTESFRLKGSKSASKFKLSYHEGSGTNITATMRTGLYETDAIGVGEETDYEVRLAVKKKKKTATATIYLTAESLFDGELDRVQMKTSYKPVR